MQATALKGTQIQTRRADAVGSTQGPAQAEPATPLQTPLGSGKQTEQAKNMGHRPDGSRPDFTSFLVALKQAAECGLRLMPEPVEQKPVEQKPVEPPPAVCVSEPIDTSKWRKDRLLVIHEATTTTYRCRWNAVGRRGDTTWPREYDFKACDGWISDHFIQGGRGNRVSWNLKTNECKVTTLDGQPVDAQTRASYASFAKGNVFPGIDLSKVS